jgi:hypothetical protein
MKDCLHTKRVSGPCCACHKPMEPEAHIPMKMAGTFCPACCPCCNPAPGPAEPVTTAYELREGV